MNSVETPLPPPTQSQAAPVVYRRTKQWIWITLLIGLCFSSACRREENAPSPPFVEVTPPALMDSGGAVPSEKPPIRRRPADDRTEASDKSFRKPSLPPTRKDGAAEAIRLSPRSSPSPNQAFSRQLTNEIGLMAYYPQQRLMPEDFRIGPLQDGLSGARDYVNAAGAIRLFLDKIMKKELDESLTAPSATAAVKAVLSYPLSRGYVPERYRIGKISYESDTELRAALRLYKNDGATTGEIYLQKLDGEWKVSDLQAGFTLLAAKYEKPKEPFMPGSYTFLLNDH